MTRSSLALVIVFGLVFTAVVPGAVGALDDPRFEVYTPEPELVPGQTTQLSVSLVNDAADVDEQVRTARNVKATLVSDTPIEVKSGTQLVGDLPDGQDRPVPFRVTVPDNMKTGTYRLTLRLEYEYDDNSRGTTRLPVTVRVEDRPRFSVVQTRGDVPIGDTGTFSLLLRNVGTENVTDATVTVRSQSPDITFGNSPTASRYVGAWRDRQFRRVEFEARVAPGAERREYALTATVNYEDSTGTPGASQSLALGLTPAREQSFALRNVTADVRVGREGSIEATVVNQGPETARDLVLRSTTQQQNVDFQETEYAVGDLAANQSAQVSFPVEVSEGTEAGPRRFSFVAEYQNRNDETRRSDPLTTRIQVAPFRNRFLVEAKNATVTAGGSGTYTLVLTNNDDQTLTSINAKAFVDDPLSLSDDEAYVDSLEPGESTEIKLGVGASGSALAKDYPLSIDFQYETPDGDSKLSDTYTVPVSVQPPPEQQGPPTTLVVGGIVAVLVVLAGAYWFRRRRRSAGGDGTGEDGTAPTDG